MLTDEINLTMRAGDGGRGKIHFAPRKGGPDGGNGGRGGSLYIRSTSDLTALTNLTGKKIISAENGQDGSANKMAGKSGGNLVINIPVGSEITDLDSKEKWEVTPGSTIKLCAGGEGGRGNFEFRSATNRTPREAEPGQPGVCRQININLKLFANVGIIGLPNAGKSSLLNSITNAHAKTGAYPFTTLEPNLGVCNNVILADIPGLIAGAHQGRGLGVKFLKHISKVSQLFHCISSESTDPLADYNTIRQEIHEYNPAILDKPEIILFTKIDLLPEHQLQEKIRKLKPLNKPVIPISVYQEATLTKLQKLIGSSHHTP